MSRSRFPIRVCKSVGLSALAALGLVGGCGLAETQPDERLASVEKAAPASSLKVLAGSAVSQSDGSYDLHGGVVVNFNNAVTLRAERVTVREGQPWQIYGFSLSHPGGTLTGDRGTFDPQSQTYTAQGSVSVDPRAD